MAYFNGHSKWLDTLFNICGISVGASVNLASLAYFLWPPSNKNQFLIKQIHQHRLKKLGHVYPVTKFSLYFSFTVLYIYTKLLLL